jgi:uncharacterized membrane protein YhaH (DUF805 family)
LASIISILFFSFWLLIIPLIVFIFHIPAFFSLLSRRLHDTGKSGCWIFMCFMPFIAILAILFVAVFCMLDSEKKENKYGKSNLN